MKEFSSDSKDQMVWIDSLLKGSTCFWHHVGPCSVHLVFWNALSLLRMIQVLTSFQHYRDPITDRQGRFDQPRIHTDNPSCDQHDDFGHFLEGALSTPKLTVVAGHQSSSS